MLFHLGRCIIYTSDNRNCLIDKNGNIHYEVDNILFDYKLFDTLNIEGMDGYEDTILPLLRGFGLDGLLTYLDTTVVDGVSLRNALNAKPCALKRALTVNIELDQLGVK